MSPDVSDTQRALVGRYGHLLVNTGGNDVLELLQDLQKPQPNHLMATNLPRFVLAVSVQAQLSLLARLELNRQVTTPSP